MWMKNGVLIKGPPPKNNSTGPKIITHRSQRTAVVSSGRRLDALIEGKARICLFRSLGGLGDIIMATPIARGVKRKFPNSHLTYAVPTDYAGGDLVALLEHIPYIDEVIDYKIAERNDYDTFTNITRTGLSEEKPNITFPNRIDLFANAAGIPLFGNFTPLYIMTEEEKNWGEEFVARTIGTKQYKGLISVHLGSRDPKRSWPHHRIREFVKLASKSGYFCFLYEWGASAEEWRLAGTKTVFDYRIRQAAAIMNATDVLLCPDSMMLHLAGALNMKTVSLFGSMPPISRINHYPNAIAVVNQQISCLGCVYSSCPNNFYCMSSILPEAVLIACSQKIKSDLVPPSSNSLDDFVKPGVFCKKAIATFSM
jgi:ADP-heptose:LPS heptosyltransferase